MAALGEISLKLPDGKYMKLTISISDTPNQYGQNISVYKKQSDTEYSNKAKKEYVANGNIYWTDGKISVSKIKPKEQSQQEEHVPLAKTDAWANNSFDDYDPDDKPF